VHQFEQNSIATHKAHQEMILIRVLLVMSFISIDFI